MTDNGELADLWIYLNRSMLRHVMGYGGGHNAAVQVLRIRRSAQQYLKQFPSLSFMLVLNERPAFLIRQLLSFHRCPGGLGTTQDYQDVAGSIR